MVLAGQIFLFIAMLLSFILALGGEKDQQDRASKIFGMSLAAFLVSIFLLEGGFM